MIFIGKDPKEQPEKSRVINAHQNPSHFNNSKRRLVVFCNHYIYFFVVPKAKTPKQGKINKRFMEYGYSHPKKIYGNNKNNTILRTILTRKRS